MTREEYDHIAQQYGKNFNLDIISYAGEKDGYIYYDMSNNLIKKCRRTGMPHIIKINNEGAVFDVKSIPEIIWATQNLE